MFVCIAKGATMPWLPPTRPDVTETRLPTLWRPLHNPCQGAKSPLPAGEG